MDESDSEELLENAWSLSKRRKILLSSYGETSKHFPVDCEKDKLVEQTKKFEELKAKSSDIMQRSSIRRHKTELRRSQKLMKKALKDPWIKAAVEGDKSSISKEASINSNEEDLESVKPFFYVNKHLQGPVSHGNCGPKIKKMKTLTDFYHSIFNCDNPITFS